MPQHNHRCSLLDFERAARRVCSAAHLPYDLSLTPGENIDFALTRIFPHLDPQQAHEQPGEVPAFATGQQ